jgi:nucleoside-diphosphate-sugar epimerase
MTTVAVTGASGYVGRVLLTHLSNDATITRVVGIDTVEPTETTRNLEFYRMDVRAPDLAEAFRGVDAVVHLAAVAGDDADEIRDVNIGGTRAVADAAARAAVRKIVFGSSHRVYGAHPDNDFPLTESSPVRPSHDDVYAMSKAEAESLIAYQATDANMQTVILRLAWISGPRIPTSHAGVIDARVRVKIKGYDPAFQAVHEDDVARAIAFAIRGDLSGTFNVSPEDAVAEPEKLFGQRVVGLDAQRAKRLLQRTGRLGLTPDAVAMPALMYPQVMTSDALVRAGFSFEHTASEALRAAAEARRDWVAFGRLRFRPRRVALMAGTLGAVLVGSAANRRRARRASGSDTAPPTPRTRR